MQRPLVPAIALALVLGAAGCGVQSPDPSRPPASVDATPTASAGPTSSPELGTEPLTGQLAYAGGDDSQIFLLDLATGEHRQLTQLTPDDAELAARGPLAPALSCAFGVNSLAWSPDGGQLAFSYGGCDSVVHVVDLDGTLRRVGEGHTPAWSPDGTRLVFGPNIPYCGMPECTDGLAAEPPTLQVVSLDGGAPGPLSTHPSVEHAAIPSYSPDGRLIAYSGPLPDPPVDSAYPSAAWAIAADGSEASLVARERWPAGWLTDGRLLIVDPDSGVISALDLQSGEAEAIARSPGPAVVSPDGTRAVVTHYDDASGSPIARLFAAGAPEPLREWDGWASAWAPDGRAAVIFEGERGLLVVDRDGKELGAFAGDSVVNVVSVAWRPGT